MQHILVVEDESVIRTALRRLLERNNYQVSEAGSVAQAEAEYTFADFDLIISDLRLPGAPGTDLIKKAGDVPVLIMTSYASLRSAVDSMRMGAVDYIAKPFDHGDMVNAVQRIIAAHRAANPRDIVAVQDIVLLQRDDPGNGRQMLLPGIDERRRRPGLG